MRKLKAMMQAAILTCGATTVLTSCTSKDDNPIPTPTEDIGAPDYSKEAC